MASRLTPSTQWRYIGRFTTTSYYEDEFAWIVRPLRRAVETRGNVFDRETGSRTKDRTAAALGSFTSCLPRPVHPRPERSKALLANAPEIISTKPFRLLLPSRPLL